MRDYFSVVSMGRSGSTLLQRLLASHPDITSFGEVISPSGPYGRSPGRSIARFIDEDLFAERSGICGFKMPYDWILTYPDVFGAFFDLKFKIIFLRRENKLDQFISMKMAQKTGIWGSDATYGDARIAVTSGELHEFFIASSQTDIVLRQMIARFPNIAVSYEGLVAGHHHHDMLDFLGARRLPLTTDTTRSQAAARRDVVENFDELAAAFSHTAYAAFFTAPDAIE